MSTRESFVEHFGEEQAQAIEKACYSHNTDHLDHNPGSDSFRYAIAICIGFQCMEVDGYREHHGITAPWVDLHQWIIDHGELRHHDGGIDWLALAAGTYNEYVGSDD